MARKIVYAMHTVGATRFDLKYANGPMPHRLLRRSIELYATQVVPMVKDIMASSSLVSA